MCIFAHKLGYYNLIIINIIYGNFYNDSTAPDSFRSVMGRFTLW